MKKILILLIASLSIYANTISKEKCLQNEDEFIYAGGECINYFLEGGDRENILTIIIHGAWKDGTNTLARYIPFAQSISMNTDITTLAIALPGYSKSSSNNLKSLMFKDDKPKRASSKEYIVFLSELIQKLKDKYNAKTINIIAHSAGAMMSASVSGYKPDLIQNIALAGGIYKVKDLHKNTKDAVSVNNYLNNLSKNTNYLLIYGSKDKISKPKNSIDFYNELKKRDINVKLLEVKDFAHIDLDMCDESVDAITLMLEEK